MILTCQVLPSFNVHIVVIARDVRQHYHVTEHVLKTSLYEHDEHDTQAVMLGNRMSIRKVTESYNVPLSILVSLSGRCYRGIIRKAKQRRQASNAHVPCFISVYLLSVLTNQIIKCCYKIPRAFYPISLAFLSA